jgi:hypothetical protein
VDCVGRAFRKLQSILTDSSLHLSASNCIYRYTKGPLLPALRLAVSPLKSKTYTCHGRLYNSCANQRPACDLTSAPSQLTALLTHPLENKHVKITRNGPCLALTRTHIQASALPCKHRLSQNSFSSQPWVASRMCLSSQGQYRVTPASTTSAMYSG